MSRLVASWQPPWAASQVTAITAPSQLSLPLLLLHSMHLFWHCCPKSTCMLLHACALMLTIWGCTWASGHLSPASCKGCKLEVTRCLVLSQAGQAWRSARWAPVPPISLQLWHTRSSVRSISLFSLFLSAVLASFWHFDCCPSVKYWLYCREEGRMFSFFCRRFSGTVHHGSEAHPEEQAGGLPDRGHHLPAQAHHQILQTGALPGPSFACPVLERFTYTYTALWPV